MIQLVFSYYSISSWLLFSCYLDSVLQGGQCCSAHSKPNTRTHSFALSHCDTHRRTNITTCHKQAGNIVVLKLVLLTYLLKYTFSSRAPLSAAQYFRGWETMRINNGCAFELVYTFTLKRWCNLLTV